MIALVPLAFAIAAQPNILPPWIKAAGNRAYLRCVVTESQRIENVAPVPSDDRPWVTAKFAPPTIRAAKAKCAKVKEAWEAEMYKAIDATPNLAVIDRGILTPAELVKIQVRNAESWMDHHMIRQ
jgi:hypothetical protein